MDIFLQQHVSVLVFFALLSCIIVPIASKKGFFCSLQGNDENVEISFWNVFTAFLFYFIVPVVLLQLVFAIWSYFLGRDAVRSFCDTYKGWFSLGAMFLSFVCLASCFMNLKSSLRKAIWYNKQEGYWWRDIIQGFVGWLVGFPLVVVAGQIVAILLYLSLGFMGGEQVVVSVLRNSKDDHLLLVLFVVAVTFFIPIAEEILFRGFLQTWLSKFFKKSTCIVLSAVLFSLFHFELKQGLANMEFITSLFVLSCFLGFVYERQKSLIAPIVLHVIFNTCGIAALLLYEGL